MNPSQTPTTTPALDPDATSPCAIAAPEADARLVHLFRESLRQGRIHPLWPPIVRYRQAQAAGR